MLYKLINEYSVRRCPQNGVLTNGQAISNLPLFFEQNPDLAKENGYYPLTKSDMPEYDESKYYLRNRYSLADDTIVQEFEIIEVPALEEENASQER